MADTSTPANDVELVIKDDGTAPTSSQTEEAKEAGVDEHVPNDEETAPNDRNNEHTPPETEDDTVTDIQREMAKHTKQAPSLYTVIHHKTTWREYFEFYNVFRIFIAAVIGIAIFLTLFAVAYLLNPDTCKIQRSAPHRLQAQPFLNALRIWWREVLFFVPVIQIFGREWKWERKVINITSLLVVVGLFVLKIPSAFFPGDLASAYQAIMYILFGISFLIYVFTVGGGFYTIWILFPFVVTFILLILLLGISVLLFSNAILPHSPLFDVVYVSFTTLLGVVLFRFDRYSFPYKCGKCCTCPWNKNAARQTQRSEVTISNELSDLLVFYIGMLVVTYVETFRISGYVLKFNQDGISGLYFMLALSISLECISRNALFWEFLYRCILKKQPEARDRVRAIIEGCRYQAEYVPIWCVALFNVFHYGPSQQCGRVRSATLSDSVNIHGQYWLIAVLVICEFVADIISELVLKIGRCLKMFGVKNEANEDPPRKTILVKPNLIPMVWVVLHCYVVSMYAFILDNNIQSA